MPRSANCGWLMPPGAAFCPVFGGAFTVRFVTFSVVMGDGTDLNVTAAIGPSTDSESFWAMLKRGYHGIGRGGRRARAASAVRHLHDVAPGDIQGNGGPPARHALPQAIMGWTAEVSPLDTVNYSEVERARDRFSRWSVASYLKLTRARREWVVTSAYTSWPSSG